MNSFNGIGRLQKEPVLTKGNDGVKVCEFTLMFDDMEGKPDYCCDSIAVKVYGEKAKACDMYLRAGVLAGVTGPYRNKEGEGWQGIVADNVQILQWPERDA